MLCLALLTMTTAACAGVSKCQAARRYLVLLSATATGIKPPLMPWRSTPTWKCNPNVYADHAIGKALPVKWWVGVEGGGPLYIQGHPKFHFRFIPSTFLCLSSPGNLYSQPLKCSLHENQQCFCTCWRWHRKARWRHVWWRQHPPIHVGMHPCRHHPRWRPHRWHHGSVAGGRTSRGRQSRSIQAPSIHT